MRLSPGCEWQEVQQIAKSHALLSSRWRGPQPLSWLLATNDIVLGQQFQEIFISYGIQEYWLPYIASKVSQLRVANEGSSDNVLCLNRATGPPTCDSNAWMTCNVCNLALTAMFPAPGLSY